MGRPVGVSVRHFAHEYVSRLTSALRYRRDSDRPHVKRLLGPLPVQHLSEPYFSPSLHAPPPEQWPPTLVYYGAAESFAPSIRALVSRLTEAGTSVTSCAAEEILEKFSHDFLIFGSVELAWPDRVTEAWTRIRAWVRALKTEH